MPSIEVVVEAADFGESVIYPFIDYIGGEKNCFSKTALGERLASVQYPIRFWWPFCVPRKSFFKFSNFCSLSPDGSFQTPSSLT